MHAIFQYVHTCGTSTPRIRRVCLSPGELPPSPSSACAARSTMPYRLLLSMLRYVHRPGSPVVAEQVLAGPFEHVIVKPVFEPQFYECMLSHLPPGDDRGGMKSLRGGSGRRYAVALKRQARLGPDSLAAQATGINQCVHSCNRATVHQRATYTFVFRDFCGSTTTRYGKI